MAEVIQDERMRNFVHAKVSSEFGLTIDQVAEKCKGYGRFKAWLNSDTTSIKEVLNKVKVNGVSPAFFASYEKTEGYNSSWGWLNHTTVNGTPLTDSDSVSKWIVTQSKNTTDQPAWIDYANYKDFVPDSVKTAGNADFNSMPAGSIGKVVIAGTAAATWEVYYPNGLLKAYNGVQDYAAPINGMIDTIEEWGGSISEDGGGGGTDPVPNPTIDFEKVINEVMTIVEKGKVDLKAGFKLNTEGVAEHIIKGLKGIFNAPLYLNSADFYSNALFKLTKTFKNILKINPSQGIDDLIKKIVDEAMKLITVDLPIDKVFEDMKTAINAIEIPEGGGGGDGGTDPEPEPSGKMFFPVNPKSQGINFWVPPDQPNMDYGGYRTGRLHWAYDIGTLGNANVSCHAVRDGEVVSVNADNLGTVIIKHTSDSYYTQYMHLVVGAFTVKAGDKVVAGQKIGIVGGTGGYDIHLHFAVSKNGTFATEADTINPRPYLKVTGNNVTELPSPV